MVDAQRHVLLGQAPSTPPPPPPAHSGCLHRDALVFGEPETEDQHNQLHCIDGTQPSLAAGKFRCAILSRAEMRRIRYVSEGVIRMGRVVRVLPGLIELEHGRVAVTAETGAW